MADERERLADDRDKNLAGLIVTADPLAFARWQSAAAARDQADTERAQAGEARAAAADARAAAAQARAAALPVTRPEAIEAGLREQLSSLRALLALSMVMSKNADDGEILDLAASAVPALASADTIAIWLEGHWADFKAAPRPPAAALDAQVAALPATGGFLRIPGSGWGFGYPLTTLAGLLGYLVVAAPEPPDEHGQFLLSVLAQNTGAALANARLHADARTRAEEVDRANAALLRSTQIHERLTRVAAAGEGSAGIARAVFELSGLPVAIEDRFGDLIAWAGPGQPDPYPRDSRARRDQMLRRALFAGSPCRVSGRLVALASPGGELMGVIALIDPDHSAGEWEVAALEHGATVLAMELAHLRGQAESQMRLRRELVEELLAGTDHESARRRARVLNYDLGRPHRVVMLKCRTGSCAQRVPQVDPSPVDEAPFHAVRRATTSLGTGSLLATHEGAVVLLAHAEANWEDLRAAVRHELGTGSACHIGVGSICAGPADFPRSLHQADLALKMQTTRNAADQVTVFENLGVYRLLSEIPDGEPVEDFARQWLGPLLDYDAAKGSALVATLSSYLECGGNYDLTAKTLSLHRSTLRYRLQRLRQLSGHDLTDPDVRFNLQLATRAWATLQALHDQ